MTLTARQRDLFAQRQARLEPLIQQTDGLDAIELVRAFHEEFAGDEDTGLRSVLNLTWVQEDLSRAKKVAAEILALARTTVIGGTPDVGDQTALNPILPRHPEVAVIIDWDLGKPVASAARVGTRTFLTAAHAVAGKPKNRLRVGIGATVDGMGSTQKAMLAGDPEIHPNYRHEAPLNDIAMLELEDDPPLLAADDIIPIATEADALAATEGVIVGFGLSDPLDALTAGVRRYGSTGFHLIDNGQRYRLNGLNEIDQLVTTCDVDSGGPLLIGSPTSGWRHVGVTSKGTDDAIVTVCGTYGVFERTSRHSGWLSGFGL